MEHSLAGTPSPDPSEKAADFIPLQYVLDNVRGEGQSPGAWVNLLHQYDPKHCYVVTQVLEYKDLWPHPLQEYIILVAHPHTDPSEAVSIPLPTVIKVVRNIDRHTFLAGLGYGSSTSDTITVLGGIDQVQLPLVNRCILLDALIWPPRAGHQPPRLWDVSLVIEAIHTDLFPHNRLFKLKSSCHHFMCATFKAVRWAFYPIPGPARESLLSKWAYFGRIDVEDPHEIARHAAEGYWNSCWWL